MPKNPFIVLLGESAGADDTDSTSDIMRRFKLKSTTGAFRYEV